VITVNHVEPEEDRNVQPRLFQGDMLQAIDLLGIGDPQDRASAALFKNFFHRLLDRFLELGRVGTKSDVLSDATEGVTSRLTIRG